MPNRWIEHIRKFARDNNMTYSCALSDPKIRDGYKKIPKRTKKAEREQMGAEDSDAPAPPPDPEIAKRAKKVERARVARVGIKRKMDERVAMGKEDVNVAKNKPKRITAEYKREFNRNARILKKPFEKEQDEIYEKLEKQILGENRYRDDARRTFNDIVRRATPYNEAETIWNINRERVNVPLFKRYRELQDEIEKIPYYMEGGVITRSGKTTGQDAAAAAAAAAADAAADAAYHTPPQSPQGEPQVPDAPVAAQQPPDPNQAVFHFNPQQAPAQPLFQPQNPYETPEQNYQEQPPPTTPTTGGSQMPMEDNFFFPPRDRDRRYVMENHSRVIPHHKFFGM